MPRILVWSDLHFDAYRGMHPIIGRQMPDHDILVVAGDVCENPALAVEIVGSLTTGPVILTLGNHEALNWVVGEGNNETVGLARRAAAGTHVHVLERDIIEIDGVRFVGGTLWSDFRAGGEGQPLGMLRAQQAMRDHHEALVADGGGLRRFLPSDALAIHEQTRAMLEAVFHQETILPTVMVTHHAPSLRSISKGYEGDVLNGAFVSNLDHLFDLPFAPSIAIHGHVHQRHDYRLGNSRVVCNPLGYPGENTGFDPYFTFDI